MKVDEEYWSDDKETLFICGKLNDFYIRLKFPAKLISAYIYDKENSPSTWFFYSKKIVKFIVQNMCFIDFYIEDKVIPSMVVKEYGMSNEDVGSVIIVNVSKKLFEHSGFKNLFNPKGGRCIRRVDIGY